MNILAGLSIMATCITFNAFKIGESTIENPLGTLLGVKQ